MFQEAVLRLGLAAVALNVAILGFIYTMRDSSSPGLLCAQLSIPLCLWEILLFVAFAPDEWLDAIIEILNDDDLDIQQRSPPRRAHVVRSSGDYSLRGQNSQILQ